MKWRWEESFASTIQREGVTGDRDTEEKERRDSKYLNIYKGIIAKLLNLASMDEFILM